MYCYYLRPFQINSYHTLNFDSCFLPICILYSQNCVSFEISILSSGLALLISSTWKLSYLYISLIMPSLPSTAQIRALQCYLPVVLASNSEYLLQSLRVCCTFYITPWREICVLCCIFLTGLVSLAQPFMPWNPPLLPAPKTCPLNNSFQSTSLFCFLQIEIS